jgi:hypothetical protein
LQPPTHGSIDRSGAVLSVHLAVWPESDCSKAKHGTNLVNASLKGAVLVDETQKEVIDKAFEKFWEAFWAFFGVLLNFVKLGKVFGKIPYVGQALERTYRAALARLLTAARGLARNVFDQASRQVGNALGGAAKDYLDGFLTAAMQMFEEALGGATELGGESSAKTQLRNAFGDLSANIDAGVAATLASVEGGGYLNNPPNIGRYFGELLALRRQAPDLDLSSAQNQALIDTIADAASNMVYAGLALVAIGGLSSLTGIGAVLGVPAAGVGTSLLALGGPAGLAAGTAGTFVKGSAALGQFGYAFKLGEEYKRLTARMVHEP